MLANNQYDLIIVGGGIIGAATFYEFQKKYPDQRVLILEKESLVATHQTGRNSGVMHSGVYYTPGSLKAINCRKGLKQLYAFCRENNIPNDNCGKLIVAKKEKDILSLEQLKERGVKNGLVGLEILDSKQAKDIEPYVECLKALYVSETGIVDYAVVTKRLIELGLKTNPRSVIKFNQKVHSFSRNGATTKLRTITDTFQSNKVVFCTGLQSDRFAKKDGLDLAVRVVPFRGDYFVLEQKANYKVKNLIYPLANPNLPFLGVHLTRMMNGTIECGPSAVFSFKREGYQKVSFDIKDSKDALTFGGSWKLFGNFWQHGATEFYRAFSKRQFLKSVQDLVPTIEMNDLGKWRAGVRAQVVGRDGRLIDDFLIEKGECGIHIINAPSPAATACLSIGKSIVEKIE